VAKVSVVTGFRVPPLVVDYNQLWIQAELRGAGNGEEWASRSAAELVSRQHWAKYRTRKGKKRVTAVLEQAAVISRKRQDASMGFILIPSATEGVKGMAAFCPADLAGYRGDEAWDELLKRLIAGLPGDQTREITDMETKAGPCRRLQVRYARDPEQPPRELVAYVWIFDDYQAAIIMDISFVDLAQAARWLPALDDLARDVWLQGDGGPPEGH
jgi:hypothetical protein